jgi:outer membrane phospholipase A
MEITDELLLEVYLEYWMQAFDQSDKDFNEEIQEYKGNPILIKAAKLGRKHCILGDDFPKYDELTNSEILKLIKKL